MSSTDMSNTSDDKVCEKTVADCPNSFFTVDQETCECKCTELVCIATMSVDTDKCECVPIDFGKKPSKVTDMNSDDEGSEDSDDTHSHNGYEHSHPHSGQNKPKNDYYLVDPNEHDPQEHENTHEHDAIMAKLTALEDAIIKAKE